MRTWSKNQRYALSLVTVIPVSVGINALYGASTLAAWIGGVVAIVVYMGLALPWIETGYFDPRKLPKR